MKTRAIVFSGRDHMVAPDLVLWLLHCGLKSEDITFTRSGNRDQCATYNFGLKLAIEGDADRIIFADGDMRPHPVHTAPLLTCGTFDLVCAKSDTGCASWPKPQSFHTGLWTARREVLRQIGLPAFQWPTTADGARITGCVCNHFVKRARALGFTHGNAGTCGHIPRQRDGLPDTLCFA